MMFGSSRAVLLARIYVRNHTSSPPQRDYSQHFTVTLTGTYLRLRFQQSIKGHIREDTGTADYNFMYL